MKKDKEDIFHTDKTEMDTEDEDKEREGDSEDMKKGDTEEPHYGDPEAHQGDPEDGEMGTKYNIMDGEQVQCKCHNLLVSISRGKQTRPHLKCSKIQRPLARPTRKELKKSDYIVYISYFYNTMLL